MTRLRHLLFVFLLVFQFVFAGMILAPARVSAAEATFCTGSWGGFFGFPTWYHYLDYGFADGGCNVEFNLRNAEDYVRVGMAVFEIVMRIAGYAAIAFVLYGAFQFLTSQGEPDRIAGARTTLSNAIIGLLIALFAVAIVNLVGANVV